MTDETRELAALAERVEAATGADRELDCLIAVAVGVAEVVELRGRPAWARRDADGNLLLPGQAPDMLVPAFTASLDAAMTLATGFVLLHLSDIGADGLPLCKLGDPGTTPAGEWTGIASSLERAVCSAALRARARALFGTGESR